MYTITLADVVSAEIRGDDVKLTAELYVDHKRPRERITLIITRYSIITCAHDDALDPRLCASRELVHAARLFGKML